MTTALKTRTKKIDTLYPPKEIRDNTKARRAWVEAKVAEINLLPERSAKSVGTGSYQSVSVYSVITSEARTRLRGVCQFCGHSQVVDNGRIVLHGYKRPGNGWTFGRCPGVYYAPLNVEDTLTLGYSEQAEKSLVIAKAEYAAAIAATKAAQTAQGDNELDAYRNAPVLARAPWRGVLTAEQLASNTAAKAAWVAKYPLTAAYRRAVNAQNEASNAHSQAEGQAAHFRTLLASGTKGTPLTVEVV